MQVSRLVNPEWLVEIEADAVISDGSAPIEIKPVHRRVRLSYPDYIEFLMDRL
jgi:hypothetical protein